MIEPVVGGRLWGNGAALGVDHHMVGVNSDLAQHRTDECGFVLTVAVMMREYLGRGMGLKSSDTQFDGYIPDIVLNEVADGLHLLQLRGFRCRQLSYLLFNIGRCV